MSRVFSMKNLCVTVKNKQKTPQEQPIQESEFSITSNIKKERPAKRAQNQAMER